MNYTIIGFSEDTSYHDRCGDYIHQPGVFETFFTRDRSEFVRKWAAMEFSTDFEDLKILLNGIPDDHNDPETDELYYALVDEKNVILTELGEARDKAIAEAASKAKAAAAEQDLRRAEIQRIQDLQQLEALKKKLGM